MNHQDRFLFCFFLPEGEETVPDTELLIRDVHICRILVSHLWDMKVQLYIVVQYLLFAHTHYVISGYCLECCMTIFFF